MSTTPGHVPTCDHALLAATAAGCARPAVTAQDERHLEMMMTDTSKKQHAQSHFKKTRQEGEAVSAMAEYKARAVAVRERMEQLKALRLTAEASGQALAPRPKPKAAAKKTPAKADKAGKKSAATLADWLNEQGRSGRRS